MPNDNVPPRNLTENEQTTDLNGKETDVFECRTCSFKTSNSEKMSIHEFIHSQTPFEKRPYECSQCGYCTRWSTDYKNHSLLHSTEEKPHRCRYCLYSSVRKSDLKKHLKTCSQRDQEYDYADIPLLLKRKRADLLSLDQEISKMEEALKRGKTEQQQVAEEIAKLETQCFKLKT